VAGSIILAGSAPSQGEAINWGNILSGVSGNELNYRGQGSASATGSAYTTGFAISSGVCTVTAANNFVVGQSVTFAFNTQTLSAKFNNVTATVVTASSSSFTFATAITGTTTTGDVGIAVSGKNFRPDAFVGPTLGASVTSLAATATSGGVPAYITVTAANYYLPGATVTFSGLGTTLGLLLNGGQFTVWYSTGSTFTFFSTLTGSAGGDTGTASGQNPPVPYEAEFWSENSSGYQYQYSETLGGLWVLQSGGATPAGTISSTSTAPTITTSSGGVSTALGVAAGALSEVTGASGITGVQAPTITSTFTGTAIAAAALAKITSGAYPAGVLSDVIKYKAKFARGI
jgi:hypothetical protein